MEQYIPKSALLAEIERLVNNYDKALDYEAALEDVRDFIDTLEVKEVDFSIEVYKYIEKHFNVYDDGNQTLQTKDKKSLIGRVDIENIAKYFFELGIAVSNKAQKGE